MRWEPDGYFLASQSRVHVALESGRGNATVETSTENLGGLAAIMLRKQTNRERISGQGVGPSRSRGSSWMPLRVIDLSNVKRTRTKHL